MSSPLLLFVLTLVIPLFFGASRSCALWLFIQALALAWIAYPENGWTTHSMIVAAELVVVRGLVVPRILRLALRSDRHPSGHLLPSNLFVWTIAIMVLTLGYVFGASASTTPEDAALFGSVAAAMLLAVLLLASNDARSSQLVAVLWLENAIALFELSLPSQALGIHVALSASYVATVLLFAWFLPQPHAAQESALREVL